MAAILYTSGSTGKPKGVVLSHRNMVAGAKSVAQYLENHADDTLLAALPLSFDAGFSQLTTAFHVGARVVLHQLPAAARRAERARRASASPGSPRCRRSGSSSRSSSGRRRSREHLRYFANTGGRMPRETLDALRGDAAEGEAVS